MAKKDQVDRIMMVEDQVYRSVVVKDWSVAAKDQEYGSTVVKDQEYISASMKDQKVEVLVQKDQVIMWCRRWIHSRVIIPITNCENFLWCIYVLPRYYCIYYLSIIL